jgi:hypothetical protein
LATPQRWAASAARISSLSNVGCDIGCPRGVLPRQRPAAQLKPTMTNPPPESMPRVTREKACHASFAGGGRRTPGETLGRTFRVTRSCHASFTVAYGFCDWRGTAVGGRFQWPSRRQRG